MFFFQFYRQQNSVCVNNVQWINEKKNFFLSFQTKLTHTHIHQWISSSSLKMLHHIEMNDHWIETNYWEIVEKNKFYRKEIETSMMMMMMKPISQFRNEKKMSIKKKAQEKMSLNIWAWNKIEGKKEINFVKQKFIWRYWQVCVTDEKYDDKVAKKKSIYFHHHQNIKHDMSIIIIIIIIIELEVSIIDGYCFQDG